MEAALKLLCSQIDAPSVDAGATARVRLDRLTKPQGSLGRLEDLAAQWISVRQDAFAEPICKAVYVFAGDHGVTAEGVSAYPREVTHQMVLNFVTGGAAINVLARLHQATLHVVDVGVDADLSAVPGLVHRKVARGTANFALAAAMSEDEMYRALAVGMEQGHEAAAAGVNLIAIGEMGIGNTTAAAAITCALTGALPGSATGSGTGVDAAGRTRKAAVIERTLRFHFVPGQQTDPLTILRTVGGLEIAAMTGAMLAAASHRMAILCDGFISAVAAALAAAIEPNIRGYLIASHRSVEPGHGLLLDHLGITPLLSLEMRLGEGTGAVLAMSIVESAVALYLGMATFQSAGVSEGRE